MDFDSVLMSLRIKYIEGNASINSKEYTKTQIDCSYNSAGRIDDGTEVVQNTTEPTVLCFWCWLSPPGAHHGCQAGLAAAAVQPGIPDTLRWRLWWICLLRALWPPSDPSYWETSVSDPDLTHSLSRTHTLVQMHTSCILYCSRHH